MEVAGLLEQLFFALLNDGENSLFGHDALCFRLKQSFANCSFIVRVVQKNRYGERCRKEAGLWLMMQYLLALMKNRENRVSGFVVVCFWLNQLVSHCFAINRD